MGVPATATSKIKRRAGPWPSGARVCVARVQLSVGLLLSILCVPPGGDVMGIRD